MDAPLLLSPLSTAPTQPPSSCCPARIHYALDIALRVNTKSSAVVSLLRKCLVAWEYGDISALIDLCGESDHLLWNKEYAKRPRCQARQ